MEVGLQLLQLPLHVTPPLHDSSILDRIIELTVKSNLPTAQLNN